MIYDSLEKIPIVTFFKVAETGDFLLLSDTETDIKKLELVWNELYKEHELRQKNSESKKEFTIHNEIASLESDLKFVLGAICALAFEFDQELIDILKKLRYIVRTDTTENYYEDLKTIQRNASGITFKIQTFKNQLPKSEKQKETFEKFTIYDTMASYTVIVGYDIDYETVSYTKFYAIQRQVHLKIKSISESQGNQPKKT